MTTLSTGGPSEFSCKKNKFLFKRSFKSNSKPYRYEMLIGIPPFYDKNRNKMFLNIEQAPIRWPDKDKHGISASPQAQDLIIKVRYT